MTAERQPPLILASSSPRRRELLRRLGIPFTVKIPDIDESVLPGEKPAEHVRRLAGEKARAVAEQTGRGIVIGSDTIVVLDGRIIGKPESPEDAVSMLSLLAGRTHRVYSGVAVADAASGRARVEVVCSEVTIAGIAEEEIRRYVATGEPLDKAGAYAVQGEGGRFVASVEGSLTNVIGLPLRELHRLLEKSGLSVPLPGGDL